MLKSKFTQLSNRIFETISKVTPEGSLARSNEEMIAANLTENENNVLNQNFAAIESKLSNEDDKIILLLVLTKHLCPAIFNKFRTLQLVFPDTQYVGGRLSEPDKYFIPTIRTALFTLASLDYNRHIEIIRKSFQPQSPLFKLNILKPISIDPFIEDAPLECTPEFIYALLSEGKEEYQYTYSANFPATLYQTSESWEDLCLNSRETIDLMEVKSWLKNFTKLKENPLLGKSHKGYKALFFGPPGTGKTVSVGLLGKDLTMPVYRIDLSQIVSKWVGETEKNLKYIFDLASNKNWILFFDEGDALFGKRSDNSGSNDRYGNQEIAYLLQRMEEHEGIIFLCTNKQHNMDDAFRRRFSSRVEFFLPKKEESFIIWKRYTSELDAVLEEKDLRRIVEKVQVSGAAIKNFCKWMKILQYDNLHKTEEQIMQNAPIDKYQFLELMSKYFGRYEGQSLDQRLFS